MTMSDEDRIQLMLLVKEGKISVQEAIDTVCSSVAVYNIIHASHIHLDCRDVV